MKRVQAITFQSSLHGRVKALVSMGVIGLSSTAFAQSQFTHAEDLFVEFSLNLVEYDTSESTSSVQPQQLSSSRTTLFEIPSSLLDDSQLASFFGDQSGPSHLEIQPLHQQGSGLMIGTKHPTTSMTSFDSSGPGGQSTITPVPLPSGALAGLGVLGCIAGARCSRKR